ncbi:MAG: 5-formyltetrahydrofolate cyclo-ligase [Bacteroidota bacterium]|nr:5-formyltetrahydrofolate cyclo-ligase [Bacteroidota bacterium]
MNKAELRKHYKHKRKQLHSEQIEELSIRIANQLLLLPIWNKNYFHIFITISELHEINTEYIINILMGRDKEIIIPKTNLENNTLTHYLLTDNTKLSKNSLNIIEPQSGIIIEPNQIEVVFVPLLAYDCKGNRVGYGKGFYDRFLAQTPPQTLKIGLSFFEPETLIQDTLPTDLPLDFCITPHQIYDFRQPTH